MSFIQKYKSILLPIKRAINAGIGWDISKYPTHEFAKKMAMLKYLKINVLIDVGANIGQYASEMRASGYKGTIYSFEPVSESYRKLKKLASKDKNWEVFHCALGAENGREKIQITQNTVSSSLLQPSENLIQMESATAVTKSEEIEVKTFDTIYDELNLNGSQIFLKMDVQGYEDQVLKGAEKNLSKISLIQMEMPLVKTYEGGKDFYELDEFMRLKNFKLVSIDSGYSDPKTGFGIEVDGMYLNLQDTKNELPESSF